MKSLQIFSKARDTNNASIFGVFDDVGFFQIFIFSNVREKKSGLRKKKVQSLNLLHEFSIRQDQQNQFCSRFFSEISWENVGNRFLIKNMFLELLGSEKLSS